MAVDTAAYRVEFRTRIWPWYSGTVHFAFSNILLGGITFALLSGLRGVRPAEWLAIPVAFLFANVIEYVAHRYPLHRPMPGGRRSYTAHAIQHHRFFTSEVEASMVCESNRDYFVILFGPLSQSILLGGVGLPAALLVAAATSRNVALLFSAVSVAYFLLYEWLHLIYHLPLTHPLARFPGVRRLRHHHLIHHDLKLMSRYNFNITFPIIDALVGTTYPEPVPPSALAASGRVAENHP
jgi:sterol desaturase/sphingolipid hydroxylase (fatty acid hydroxylase superfamily)